jgi:hypothetical protein
MSKLILGTLLVLLPALAFTQTSPSSSSLQLATITNVKPLPSPGNSEDGLYEVSISVGQTHYVVLTPVPPPAETAVYAVGRQLLVRIGDNAIMWNDIMGQSYKAAIISKSPAADTSRTKE